MVKHQHNPIIGAAWMMLAGLCFALNNSAVAYMNETLGLHRTVIGFFQYFVAFIVMLPWIIKSGLTAALKTERLMLHVIRVFMSVIGIQLWLWALAWPIPISQAIGLLMTSPIFVTIGSAVFLKEKVGLSRWIATVVAVIGSLIILDPFNDNFQLASLLPVAAAFFWAIYSLMVRHLSDTESTGSMVVYLLILIAPFNFFIALPNFQAPTEVTWYFLLASGAIIALAQWSLARAYANADASFIQPFDLVKLPLNIFIAWLVFAQVPNNMFWLGASMLIGATLFILHKEKG